MDTNRTFRTTISSVENILEKELKVLDHGFVRVVDYMGGDTSIVQAARVSYGEGTKHTSSDRGLIRYLMSHHHTTPFEMCEIKLHLKMPIFTARQWIRHRTANINEISARYSILDKEFYVPDIEQLGVQSSTNNQGRSAETVQDPEAIQQLLMNASENAYNDYENMIDQKLARELSRTVLPTNFYTQFYWKIDLHNLLHFLRLRHDSHAQFEIREFAAVIDDVVQQWVPYAHKAHMDYRVNAVTLSSQMYNVVKTIMNGDKVDLVPEKTGLTGREIDFLKQKFDLE